MTNSRGDAEGPFFMDPFEFAILNSRCHNCRRGLNLHGEYSIIQDGVSFYCCQNCYWSVTLDSTGSRFRRRKDSARRARRRRVPTINDEMVAYTNDCDTLLVKRFRDQMKKDAIREDFETRAEVPRVQACGHGSGASMSYASGDPNDDPNSPQGCLIHAMFSYHMEMEAQD